MSTGRAFIFTMDAVLAFVPLFIILASISYFSPGWSLFLQSGILGSERAAQDVLEVMSTTGDLESLNQSRLNATLGSLIPSHLNYSYEVEFNGSVLFTLTNGSLSNATHVVIAKRLALTEIDSILGQMLQIFHPGTGTDYCNTGKGSGEPPLYNASLYVTAGDLSTFDYWLLVERTEKNKPTLSYEFFSTQQDCDSVNPGNNVPNGVQENGTWVNRIQVDSDLTADSWNYLYVRVSGNKFYYVNVYLIRAADGTASGDVTSQSAQLKDTALITLRVWGDEE